MSCYLPPIPGVGQSVDSFSGYLDSLLEYVNCQYAVVEDNPSVDKVSVMQDAYEAASDACDAKINYMSQRGEDTVEAQGIFTDKLGKINGIVDKADNMNINTIGMTEAIMQLMNDPTAKKIKDLEDIVVHKRYYFPGKNYNLKEYEGEDMLSQFDPRWLPEYVDLANKNGFYQWLIFYDTDGGVQTMKPISFTQILNRIMGMLNCQTSFPMLWEQLERNQGNLKWLISALVSLDYFGKLDAFVEDSAWICSNCNFTKQCLRNILDKAELLDMTMDYKLRLNQTIGQTGNAFVRDDIGWLAPMSLAFNCENEVAELTKLHVEYQKVCDRLWDILYKSGQVQICSNVTNLRGINNTVQQAMTCSQVQAGTDDKPADTKTSNVGTDENGDFIDYGDEDEPSPQNPQSPQQTQPQTPEYQPEPQVPQQVIVEQPQNILENKTLLIVLAAIILLVLIGFGVMMHMQSSNRRYMDQMYNSMYEPEE